MRASGLVCNTCQREILRAENPWQEVVGWVKHREQGGTNHVALPRPTGIYICEGCMTLLRQGLDPGQLSIVN